MQAFRNVPFFLLGMLQREWGTCLEGRKEPSILRCFFLLLSSLQIKTCPSRCWCRFFYRLKRTYFRFLRQLHLRKPFALHIADAVKGYLSPIKRIICPGISSILRTSPITETQHLPAFLPSGRKHTKSPRGHSSRWPSNTCRFPFRMDGSSSPSPVFVAVSRAVLSG